MIPHRIRVSERATARLKYLKSRTGLAPNVLSRLAFVLSIREMRRVSGSGRGASGQEFNASTLFGEHVELYSLILDYYISLVDDDRRSATIIANHIENGLDKMGHLRSLEDVLALD